MPSWRIVVHALDRTGPPMLALALIRWIRSKRSDDDLQVVAFRGGALEVEMSDLSPVEIILEPSEPWDHEHPDPERVGELKRRLDSLRPADATLLVSVAAGQALGLLENNGPILTWVVEQGEDLHWLDPPVSLAEHSDIWLAGSEGTRRELQMRLLQASCTRSADVHVVPEFVEATPIDGAVVARNRNTLGGSRVPIILGAGIGTHRKAPDLFLEVALRWQRQSKPGRFVWLGGENDPMIPLLEREVDRLGLGNMRFLDSVAEIDTWLAAGDALLHTARLDAFPLVCLHASLAGTPVVAFSGCGGVADMFGPSFMGVDYPDLHGLSKMLHHVVTSNSEAVTSAQREHVAQRFSSEVAAPTMYEHLQTAAGAETGR